LRKLLVIVGIFLISLQSASAKSIFSEFSTEVLEINGRTAIIKNSDDIIVGSSGIVTHTFKNGISTIVARADVIKKMETKQLLDLKYTNFQLKQHSQNQESYLQLVIK